MTSRWLARASRFARKAACLAVICASGCRHSGDDPGHRGASGAVPLAALGASGGPASSSLTAGPSAPLAASSLPKLVAATERSCRVMTLRGGATLLLRPPGSSRPLVQGDLLPEGALIDLDAESALTAQATVSTREMTLTGPGLVEACPRGQEEVRLTWGKLTAFPGAGVRPGAEVWVGTPLGTVRFNDAKLTIEVASREGDALSVIVTAGQGWFMPAPDVRTEDGGLAPNAGAMPLPPGTALSVRRPPMPRARWGKELVAACLRATAAAVDGGRQVEADGSARTLGDLAAAHVRARQNARGTCSSARAAAAGDPMVRDEKMRSDLEKAEGEYAKAL